MSYVLVIDKNKKPLNPCHPAEARKLLKGNKASIFRCFPFVIMLKDENKYKAFNIPPLRLKIDPGSKTSGLAIINDVTGQLLFAAEITHRGQYVHKLLLSRKAIRRSRRYRLTRYRKSRFYNRTRVKGWLPPSLESRISNTLNWAKKLIRFCPIGAISLELVKFDMQLIQNFEIQGVEYQQGELAGYELREYLLEKFKRTCVYCKENTISLEIEHVIPLGKGGTNRISNLALSCRTCNQLKGNKTAQEFGHPQVQQFCKMPLKDAAAVNATHSKLYNGLLSLGFPIEVASGGQTKCNRVKQNLQKTHWLDAACVGFSTPAKLIIKHINPLLIKATGHGSRQMCSIDKYGFPRTKAKESKKFFDFQTGDILKAIVTKGKKKGNYIGRTSVRASGFFNISTQDKTMQGINYKYCKVVQHCDGYNYYFNNTLSKASHKPKT